MNDGRRKPVWKVQFSLRTLLIFAPLAAVALSFVASRVIRHYEVTIAGFISAQDRAFDLYWRSRPKDAREDIMERTSDGVLLRAVETLPPSSRAWIESHGDALAWARRNVHITAIGKSDLLQISIVNYSPTHDDIAAQADIINALMDTFHDVKPDFMGTVPLVPFSRAGIQVHGRAQVLRHGWF